MRKDLTSPMSIFQIYVSIAMGHFVDLTLSWYGGESAMLEHVGEENMVSFRYGTASAILEHVSSGTSHQPIM